MIPIFVYSAYGSDVWSVQPSVSLAQDEAMRASTVALEQRFEVVIEAGDWNNPVYRDGQLVAGVELLDHVMDGIVSLNTWSANPQDNV